MSQTRYAKALYNLAQEKNLLDDSQNVLQQIKHLSLSLQDFHNFLNNPLLSYEERSKVFHALFKNKIPDIIFTFLLFVAYKNRLNILNEIVDAFDALYLAGKKQTRAIVQTALALPLEDQNAFKQCLNNKSKSDVIPQWEIKPSLLGGFRVYMQGSIFDYSFTSQLERFKQKVLS